MIGRFRQVLGDPILRMILWAVFLFGTFACSAGIFQSLIAVTVFGIGDTPYALILLLGLMVSVSASIGVGIVTDQRPSRKQMALMATVAMIAGGLLVAGGRSPVAFVVAHALLFPVCGTLFGQIFAVARLHVAPLPRAERDGILAIIRATFAVPFVVILPLWSFVFAQGWPLLTIYPVLIVVGAALLALVALWWPSDANAPWTETKSGLGFRASLAELTTRPVLIRVMLIGAIHSGSALAGVTLGLIFAEAPTRGPSDVALFFAFFVAIEVALTLMIVTIRKWLRRLYIIAIGAFLYAGFMALLPGLADTTALWLLVVPAGIGGAFIYALSIGYLQDLLGSRAGAGASLIALQRLASDGLCALIFAVGAALSGYGLVMVIGAVTVSGAMIAILWLDRMQTDPL